MTESEEFKDWPSTPDFRVVEKIPYPHPYCITPKHLTLADSPVLNEASIKKAESKGAVCDICRKLHKKDGTAVLKFEEHKYALLVEVNDAIDITKMTPDQESALREYLLSIKERAEKEGYAGFTFKRKH